MLWFVTSFNTLFSQFPCHLRLQFTKWWSSWSTLSCLLHFVHRLLPHLTDVCLTHDNALSDIIECLNALIYFVKFFPISLSAFCSFHCVILDALVLIHKNHVESFLFIQFIMYTEQNTWWLLCGCFQHFQFYRHIKLREKYRLSSVCITRILSYKRWNENKQVSPQRNESTNVK